MLTASRPCRFLCSSCGSNVPIDGETPTQTIQCPRCGRAHRWEGGILILSEPPAQADYPEAVYALLAHVESRHFWFTERNRLIVSTLRKVLSKLGDRSVLDVGCGTGFVLAALEREGMRTCGLDMHLAGLRHARQRTRGLLVCEGTGRVPFKEQFDVGLLCDVIEHTSDDIGLLQSTAQALKQSGVLLITVPALPSLWTAVDEVSGHKRRYTRRTLIAAMRAAGLNVVLAQHFNSALLPAQLLQRVLLEARTRRSKRDPLQLLRQDLAAPPALLNWLLAKATRLDGTLLRSGLPGPSLIAVGYRD